MARQKNDGRGRLGGRQKGTPNRVTTLAKDLMVHWLELHNSRTNPEATQALIWEDFHALTPQDRIRVSTEFIKIILPRTLAIDDPDGNPLLTIENRLRQLCDEI